MSTQPAQWHADAFLLPPSSTGRADVRVFWLILVPAMLVCMVLYALQAVWAAIGLAATAFLLAVIIAPQIGLYAYFAWQALDAAVLASHQAVFTPAKAFAPFLLLLFAFRVGRSGTSMRVSRPFVVAMLIFGAYGLVGSVVAAESLRALMYSGQIIVQVLLLVMAVHLLDTREYVARLMLATVLGGVVAAALMLITGGRSREFTRGTLGEFANPNTTALALSIALAAIPAAWACTRRKVFYVFYVAAAPLLIVAMLKTGSRSALMAVFVACVLGVLLARGAGMLARVIVAAACTITVVYIAVATVQSDILDAKSRGRIEEFVRAHGDVGDSRRDIWRLGFETYAQAPVIGVGFGNAAVALEQTHGWYKEMHSSYLASLLEGGVIGLGLFGWALWQLVRCVRRIGRSSVTIPASIMLFLLLASCLAHTIHFSKWFWVPATLCLLLAEQAHREQTSELAGQAVGQPRAISGAPTASRVVETSSRHAKGRPV